MKKSKKQTVKIIVFMFFISIALISLYLFIRTRTNPLLPKSVTSMSEAEVLLKRNIEENYPSSPREVLKLYSRMSQSLINDGLKPDQVEKMVKQMRLLFDEELLNKNPYDDQLADLNEEISIYNKAKRTIMSYSLGESSDIEYWQEDQKSYASIIVSYTLKESSDYSKIYENFLLRQDKNENWKIVGWGAVKKSDDNTKEESE